MGDHGPVDGFVVITGHLVIVTDDLRVDLIQSGRIPVNQRAHILHGQSVQIRSDKVLHEAMEFTTTSSLFRNQFLSQDQVVKHFIRHAWITSSKDLSDASRVIRHLLKEINARFIFCAVLIENSVTHETHVGLHSQYLLLMRDLCHSCQTNTHTLVPHIVISENDRVFYV